MATVIDSLIISLGIETKQFTDGQRDAIEQLRRFKSGAAQTAKEVEAEGKRAAQFFSSVKTEALSLIGILVGAGGLESFIRDTTTSLTRLGDTAMHVGVAAPQLAAFANMIARQGGSAEAAAASFTTLTDAVESYRLTGTSSMANFFNRLGVDRNDNALTVLEKFQAFAQKNAGDVPLINFIGHGIGLDQGTIDAVVRMRTVAKMNEELGKSYELGVPTPEMIGRAKEFQEALTGLGQAAEHDGDMLLNKLYPGLTAATNGLTKFIEQNPKALTGLALLGGWLITISALNFSALIAVLGRLASVAPFFAAILEFTTGASGDAEPTTPQELEKLQHDRWGSAWTSIKRWFGVEPPIADQSISPVEQKFLQNLSDPESGGAYDLKNGGSHFTDFSKFPEGVGPGGTSSAAGRYQFTSDTWKEIAGQLGLTDFSPASQDRAALALAAREYYQKTGRSLFSDLQSGGHGADIAGALHGRWPTITESTGAGEFDPHAPHTMTQQMQHAFPSGAPRPANNNTSSVSVGTINVHTMATDATGIARDIQGALADITITQSNRGLQ